MTIKVTIEMRESGKKVDAVLGRVPCEGEYVCLDGECHEVLNVFHTPNKDEGHDTLALVRVV